MYQLKEDKYSFELNAVGYFKGNKLEDVIRKKK